VSRSSSAVALQPEPGPTPPSSRRERLSALYNEYSDGVWRLLRRFGNDAARADDLCQQTFMVALDRLDDLRPGSERAFLAGVALRLSKKTLSRLSRDEPVESALEVSDPALGPEERSELERKRRLLERVLGQLTEDLRVAFVLHELEGYTQREIAELLQIPDGTVASRLRRARESFDALLAPLVEEASR